METARTVSYLIILSGRVTEPQISRKADDIIRVMVDSRCVDLKVGQYYTNTTREEDCLTA